jgi:chitin synthase
VPSEGVSEQQQQEDYYRAVRTYMVLAWMVANAVLAMAVSEAYNSKSVADNFYLKFILWSVAGVAFFRAIGSGAFGVINIVNAIGDGRVSRLMEWVRSPGSWFDGVRKGRGGSVGSKRSWGSGWSSKLSSMGGSVVGR